MSSHSGRSRRRRWAAALLCTLASAITAAAQDPLAPVAPPAGPPTALPEVPPTVPGAGDATGAPPTGGTAPAPPAPTPVPGPLYDSLHCDDNYGLKSLFDSLHPKGAKGKGWYEKLSIKGYVQFRFDRTVDQDPNKALPFMTGGRGITGSAEGFSFRRARFILSGDVSDHLYLYWQQEWAITLPGTTSPDFSQIRDLYGDVYLDKEKVHRLRIGQSKVPFGFDNLQSSQNRVFLDRSDAINSATVFNERDLGVFYYWTPVEKQKLLKDLVDGGLKGTGNYGIFGFGVYNGQGLSQLEQNRNLHTVARVTWPVQFDNGQVVEASIQGYTGEYVVDGTPIRALGRGGSITPAGTRQSGDQRGFRDQRVAATFVWYPQPFGIQAEWEVGEGPALNDAQTRIVVRQLNGGYIGANYKIDTASMGIFTPYARFQYFRGGYKGFANAPYGSRDEYNLGVEWQIRKEMELTLEYAMVNGVNLNAIDRANTRSYRNFDGSVLRAQFQMNY